MSNQVLPRHPRRFGFLLFNVLVVGAIAASVLLSDRPDSGGGLAAIPSTLVGPVVTFLLVATLVFGWIGWGLYVLFRHIGR